MSIEYGKVDWRDCLLAINASFIAGTAYTGPYSSRNQDEYDNQTTWLSGITKPTWQQIIDVWTGFNTVGSGVQLSPFPPGFRMMFPYASDFDHWLFVDPTNGRTLSKTDYQTLYSVIGNTYNGQYSGIASTDFGLPKGIGGRAWITTNGTYAYGSTGGATSQTLTMSNIPQHNHSLDSNIMAASAALALTGSVALLGQLYSRITSAVTGNAGTASPTAVPIMQPYWSAGNLFISRGMLKYQEFVAIY